VLVIGIEDDGRCAGIVVTDQLLQQLASLRSDGRVLPFPTIAVRREVIDTCAVAGVEVEPSENPPLRYDGRVWVRVGPTQRIATGEEERRLTEKRRWGNLPFDQHPVRGAELGDLDLRRFREEYLPSTVLADVLRENERDETSQLRRCVSCLPMERQRRSRSCCSASTPGAGFPAPTSSSRASTACPSLTP